jgi:rhamnose transport system substrate-binding protein
MASPGRDSDRLRLRDRLFANGEWVLVVVIAVEVAVFSVTGARFLTTGNAFEITRLAVEVGLLALALTPIIITGGIDLSVGSMMGLSAVVLGELWRNAGVALPLAAALALGIGVLGGYLNAVMIARLGFPPLIVTLGTFSLFRGIAEGLTHGVESFSGFPSTFLWLGQGYVAGGVPTQLLVFIPVVAAFAWWIHRTSYGRSLYAIGNSPGGARYAGIPVRRRLMFVYMLSGFVSSVAAIIYVAHLGQAKSDAGTGYELMGISAVVLGGASIFGGRGTVLGTLLGLFGIAVLQNGLRLSDQPAELAGILTGTLLLATIVLDRLARRRGGSVPVERFGDTEDDVRNSQVGALSAVILAGALIVAVSNWALVRSLRDEVRSAAPRQAGGPVPATVAHRRVVVAMMPKAKGDPCGMVPPISIPPSKTRSWKPGSRAAWTRLP